MERNNTYKYYVIQFEELPYKDIGEYVCIPGSWIIFRRKVDQKIIVSYPVENPLYTANRVKRMEKHSDDWIFYLATVKCGTDLYEAAELYINKKINDMHYEYKCSNMNKRDQELLAPMKRKTRRPNSKSNHQIDKPLDLLETSMNDDRSGTKRLKRMALPTPDTEDALKRLKVVEPPESVSNAAEQPTQAFECLSEHQPSPTREDFPMRNSCSPEISVEESDDRSRVEEIEHVENSEQQPTQNCSNVTNPLSNSNPILDSTFFTDLFTVLRDLHTTSANSYLLIDKLRRVIIDNTAALKDVKQLIADSRSSNSDIPTTSSSTKTAVDIEKISEENQSQQQKQQEEDDDLGDDDADEAPKKRRSQKRKFVLPPEYDENDSRWTLKHRESVPGLVELMPYTEVYVNSVRLSNCKRLAKDCKSLARLLLVEIFTKSALTICSLTGTRARAYDVEGATIRPGLDKNARTVLLAFVEEYGRAKDWITTDTSSILNSLRSKMQEFRSKYG